jgi:hypothetical protein
MRAPLKTPRFVFRTSDCKFKSGSGSFLNEAGLCVRLVFLGLAPTQTNPTLVEPIEMHTEPIFQLCWLRESSSGHLDFDAGTQVPASRLELAIIGLAPGGAGETTAANAIPSIERLEVHHVATALESLERFQSLPKWFYWRMVAFFGVVRGDEERLEQARENFESICRMCDRIRAINDGRPWSEVHLPYFARREWNRRFAEFATMQFERIHGRIQAMPGVDPLCLESTALRAAALIFQPRPDTGLLPFSYVSPADSALEQPWAGLLADRWQVRLPSSLPVRRFEMLLPAPAVDAWRRSPRLHHGRYQEVWSRVALSVEWILRRLSLARHLSSEQGLQDVEASLQLMMYNAIRPWAENVRSEPYYDVLNEEHMQRVFRKSTRRLQHLMESAAEWLDQRGHHQLASEYRTEDTSLLAARVAERCLRGRAVRNMLTAETGIVNALTRFSREAKAAETPRALRFAARNLTLAFDQHLPRIFRQPGDSKEVSTAIFLDATSAMGAAVGGAPTLEVRMETADGAVWGGDQLGFARLTSRGLNAFTKV